MGEKLINQTQTSWLARSGRSRLIAAASSAAVIAMSGGAHATDNVSVVVPKSVGTGQKSIGAFGYKPDTDGAGPDTEAIFVTGYGADPATTGNPTITKVTGIGFGETPTGAPMVSEAQMRYFYGDGGSDFSISGNQGGSSFLLNPQQVGSFAPYSRAWTIEGVTVRNANGTNVPSSSDRFVRYSLNPVTSNADALVQLTNLANWSDFQAAIDADNGAAGPPTAAFVPIRQSAWSGDGQSLYHSDSSAAYGGIWKLNPLNGAVQRIVTTPRAATITEIAVLPHAGGVDRILFLGKAGDANAGGINSVDYGGSVVSSDSDVKTFLDNDDLSRFLDSAVAGRTGTASPWSISAPDASGTIYFQENTWDVTVAMTADGKLIKVSTRDERTAALGDSDPATTAGSSMLRLQTRQVTTPQGFQATQVMTTDNGNDPDIEDSVIGAIHYKPGDFNRDNLVDYANQTADRQPFLAALQPRLNYTSATLPAPSKFDLNGNRTVDWRDVKILQDFVGFEDGDTNLDGAIDFADLNTMRDNYYTLAGSAADKTWAEGDFASLDPAADVYSPTAADANLVNLVDLEVIANTWLNVLGQPNLTFADLDANGYTGAFREDVITAFDVVPEPGGAAALLVAAALGLTRRRRGR